ncbi:MAG TPA: hypothetical protein VFN10_01415 [Thermoanaerobaculia bacterium]|nr:hypothetical protein [Thermoanaerobaculia bacterium]
MSDACRFEHDVVAGRWTDSLRAHVASCEECAATMSVSPWLTKFAKIPDREHILPDPAVLFLKAQLMRATSEAARLSRPMTFFQLIAYTIIAAGWAAVLTWKWKALEEWLHPGVSMLASGSSVSLTFVAMIFVLGSATVMLAVHTILAEE